MKFSRELEVPTIPPAEDKANTSQLCPQNKGQGQTPRSPKARSKLESKALHGKYPQRVKQANVDQDNTHRWLKAASIKAETEGFMIAVQDQNLPTHWYQQHILKKPDVDP